MISIRYENLSNKYHLHFRDDYFVFRDSSLDMISGDNSWISSLFHTCIVVLCVGFSTLYLVLPVMPEGWSFDVLLLND